MSSNSGQFQQLVTCHRINLNIIITVKILEQRVKKHRKSKKGHGWAKLEKIKTDCVRVNLKKERPDFFKVISICMKVSFIMLRNHPCIACYVAFLLPMKDCSPSYLKYGARKL